MAETATLTLVDFLLARIAEDEGNAWRVLYDSGPGLADVISIRDRVLAECEAKRQIIALHESWPVLVESPPTFERIDDDELGNDLARIAFRASRQVAWLTEQGYRVRFGTEPPTAPMIRTLAQVYADHPDFRDEWRA